MQEAIYTPEEVAQLYKVTRQTVYNWISAGQLSAIRVGGHVRIRQSDLDSFIIPAVNGTKEAV